jgi:hypothetical protein
MTSRPASTDYTECGTCHVRIILAHKIPPLNYRPDPAGTVAAFRAATGAWRARFLARGEDPDAAQLEKRYSVHTCGQVADAP